MEKRSVERVKPYVAPCRIVAGERRVSGYMTDLSLRGSQLSSGAEPPGPGSHVVLEVRLGGRVAVSRLPAEVKWVQPPVEGSGGAYQLGVTFGELDAATDRLLGEVLEEFRKRAAELA